ncbi:MAG TPA: F0F1 ATP synthase subunit B [Anaerovoracaceae bacterium]|nr:F0F1 ATP synthase subunit B [Anaerovoracaceae bacterium]
MEVTLHQGLIEFNWNLLFSMITVVVLYLILKRFFFEKVHAFMVQREESVRKTLDEAEKKNNDADKKVIEYNAKISGLEDDGRKIIGDAKKRANGVSEKIILEANESAKSIVSKAELEATHKKEDTEKEMKKEIAQIAVMAAEKIIEKEIDEKKHSEIIDGIIEKAGNSKWQD